MTLRNVGFTLIEALVAMAIVGIGLTMAVPAFSSVMRTTRTAATLNQLSTDMAMARSSAIMSKASVALCPHDGAMHCLAGGDWSNGWLVFTDADANRQPDSPVDVLRVTDAPAAALLYLPASRSLLRFQPDGRAAGTNLTVSVCQDDQLLGSVIVNNLGRVRSTRTRTDQPCLSG